MGCVFFTSGGVGDERTSGLGRLAGVSGVRVAKVRPLWVAVGVVKVLARAAALEMVPPSELSEVRGVW